MPESTKLSVLKPLTWRKTSKPTSDMQGVREYSQQGNPVTPYLSFPHPPDGLFRAPVTHVVLTLRLWLAQFWCVHSNGRVSKS